MTASDIEVSLREPGIQDDLIAGHAWRGRGDTPVGRVSAIESTGSTAIAVRIRPDAVNKFVANVPVLIAANHDILNGRDLDSAGAYHEWRMVSAVTTTGNGQILTVSSTTNTYYNGAVVWQPKVGNMRCTSESDGEDRYSLPGAQGQLMRPDAPTLTITRTGTAVTSGAVTATVVKGTNAAFANYAGVYIFSNLYDAQIGPSPNQSYDGLISALGTTTATSSDITTYGGGTTVSGGGTMTTTGTYWAVAVLYDRVEDSHPYAARTHSLPSAAVKVQVK
jgi:hypothetical protein